VTNRHLCIITAGSTSLKFVAYEVTPAGPRRCLHGAVENIDEPGARLRLNSNDGNPMHDSRFPVSDHAEALAVLAELRDGPFSLGGLVGFGHRVVHGGPDYAAPVHLDAAAIALIEALQSLAPLHNTPAVAVIKTLAERYPSMPQVACFDTAFHRTHPAVADRYAIPDALYQDGVRRYGFHGLSYEFIASRLNDVAPSVALGRVVVAHLGAGASMCALEGGRSMDSSMGFSAVDGLPMGTRSGSVDPYLLLWLQQTKGWSLKRSTTSFSASAGSWACPASRPTLRRCWRATSRRPSWRWITSSIMCAVSPARSPPRWAGSTRWCSPPASASTARRFAAGFCAGWVSWASCSMRRRTRPVARC